MSWLLEAVTDSKTGKASSKRVAVLVGAFSMGVAVVFLAIGGMIGRDVGIAITGVCGSLATLGGVAYVGGKRAENERTSQ